MGGGLGLSDVIQASICYNIRKLKTTGQGT